MIRIIPRTEVLQKVAALRAADARGRDIARSRANEELAKAAGALLAGMSEEELAKAAGLFSGLGSAAQRGAQAVGGGIRKLFRKATPTSALHLTPGASVVKSGVPATGVAEGWGGIAKEKAVNIGGEHMGAQMVAPKGEQVQALRSPGRVVPREEMAQGWSSQAPRGMKQAPGNGPYRTPATPAQAPATAPTQSAPAPTSGAPAPQQGGRKGMGWGRALPWIAGGGLVYGVAKAAPWAARQLEQSSGQSMAPSMGWSPTPYGYGYTPYGDGQPTMGYGT